jgi:hypothetical protein
MKAKQCLVTAALLFVSVFSIAQSKSDFTGEWIINETKSDFADQPAALMFKGLKVTQTKDSITVLGQRFDSSLGTMTSTYLLDGSTKNFVLNDGRMMTASISWDEDGEQMTRNSNYMLPDQPDVIEYESKEAWSLSDNKKELTLTRTFIRGTSALRIIAVYDRR